MTSLVEVARLSFASRAAAELAAASARATGRFDVEVRSADDDGDAWIVIIEALRCARCAEAAP